MEKRKVTDERINEIHRFYQRAGESSEEEYERITSHMNDLWDIFKDVIKDEFADIDLGDWELCENISVEKWLEHLAIQKRESELNV